MIALTKSVGTEPATSGVLVDVIAGGGRATY